MNYVLIVQRPVNRKYKMKRKIEKTMTKFCSYQNVINGAPEFGGIFNPRLVSSIDI
jgi:hypothetical protein